MEVKAKKKKKKNKKLLKVSPSKPLVPSLLVHLQKRSNFIVRRLRVHYGQGTENHVSHSLDLNTVLGDLVRSSWFQCERFLWCWIFHRHGHGSIHQLGPSGTLGFPA